MWQDPEESSFILKTVNKPEYFSGQKINIYSQMHNSRN